MAVDPVVVVVDVLCCLLFVVMHLHNILSVFGFHFAINHRSVIIS